MIKDKQALEGGRISILGARVHNLKNIDVEIPRNKLTVITGMSGSGKSSLAFDTIFAEGQRRYVETFSAYARNFLGNMERPDVDKITGLSPVIFIFFKQKTAYEMTLCDWSSDVCSSDLSSFMKAGISFLPGCSRCV